jgi:hypothetical protein
MVAESAIREPLVTGGKTAHDVTQDISSRVEEKPAKSWLLAMAVSLTAFFVGGIAVALTLWEGI